PALAEKMARALQLLGAQHALVVHGHGGLDELTLSGPNLVIEVRAGHEPRRYEINASDLGLAPAPREALLGGDVTTNVAIVRSILSGEDQGARRDVVLLNAAAALVAADRAADLREGLEQARRSLESGAALARLERLITVSNIDR
ncbi:MAG: anthranilate phosphoribosyltransferase, partial [Blastocatellia bacterium]|nr:anthranilate phosphoribosyltransferase [Blastocatellia bacterium]